MAARRGKSQAKRNSSGGLPGWAWLVIGVLLTLLAVLLVPRYLKSDGGDGFFRPKPNPDALPAAVSDEGEAIAPDTAPAGEAKPDADKPKPTQYDFYTLLPGQEVAVSDAELAASAKAEAEAQANAKQASAAEAAPAASTPDALPAPLGETPAAATPASVPAASASAEAARTAAATRYILQAGAFGASGDAEATKARIALLGLNARVESAQIDGKTVYRVRMGPYGSASELADAKAKLAGGGLPAMAVKTH
jgi:cell division protein FtsN